MKALLFLFVSLFFVFADAQKIQTIVPKQAIVIGNAFPIQYIIADPSSLINFISPSFENLRLVSGPYRFKGPALINGKMMPVENITFTVVPLKTGEITVEGLIVNFKKGQEKSESKTIQVIPQPKASFNTTSSYTDVNLYAPSSKNWDKLIAENLFVKAEVDKSTCFLGEAVVATFKLYSRLQSTSAVINAPSLYGFSVMDMIDINEAHPSVETIHGKVFNTSVLRKLQLYPSQTGKLVIDPMQVQNEIEFYDSVKETKTKVENFLATLPITITVKGLTGKKPHDFSGGVGNYTMQASLSHNKIQLGKPARLMITIKGKGNFIQFVPPVIHFPKSLDVFDSFVSDSFNKNSAPLEGKRKYVFAFTTDSIGGYALPPVTFSFFDLVAQNYKTIYSDSLRLKVMAAAPVNSNKTEKTFTYQSIFFWIIGITIVLLAVIILVMKYKKKGKEKSIIHSTPQPNYLEKFVEINSIKNERQTCLEIQKLLLEVKQKFRLDPKQLKELQLINDECQLFAYSHVSESGKIEGLKKRTLHLIGQVSK